MRASSRACSPAFNTWISCGQSGSLAKSRARRYASGGAALSSAVAVWMDQRVGLRKEAATFAPPLRARISSRTRDLSSPFTRRIVCTHGSSASHVSSTARRTGMRVRQMLQPPLRQPTQSHVRTAASRIDRWHRRLSRVRPSQAVIQVFGIAYRDLRRTSRGRAKVALACQVAMCLARRLRIVAHRDGMALRARSHDGRACLRRHRGPL